MRHRVVGLINFLAALMVVAIALSFVPERASAQQMEDVVYLKDGSVLRGTITEQVPGESILIRTRDGNTLRIGMDRIDRMTKEAAPTTARQVTTGKKSPGLAFLLSFLITGAGQGYNGQWGKAGIMFGAAVVGYGVALANIADCVDYDESCGAAYGGLGVALVAAVWSMIDAPITASNINKRLEAGGMAFEIGPRLEPLGLGVTAEQRFALAANAVKVGPRAGISLARLSF